MNWINAVTNAISEIDIIHPGLVDKVAGLDKNAEWSDEQWRWYRDVTGAICEPYNFIGSDPSDEDFYYGLIESGDFGQIKANIPGIQNRESWLKVIDLVEHIGY